MEESWITGDLDDLEGMPQPRTKPDVEEFPEALRRALARALLHSHTAMAVGQVSDAERRVLSKFTEDGAAGLKVAGLVGRTKRLTAALRRQTDDEDCPLSQLAASVLTHEADRAILVFCLSYLMHPRAHPLEHAVDGVQRALGLPPQLHDCSRSFHLFAGVPEPVLAERMQAHMPLQRSHMLRRDHDGELILHPNLRRYLAAGAHGDPWSFLLPDTREGVFKAVPAQEIDEAVEGLMPLMPALQAGLHLRLALQHEPKGRDLAEDVLRALARRLGRQLYWVDQNEIPLVAQILARRPARVLLGVNAENRRRRDIFDLGIDEDSEPSIGTDAHDAPSVIWLCDSVPDQLRLRLDGVLQLNRKSAAGYRIMANALRAGGLDLPASETTQFQEIGCAVHPADLARAAARVAAQRGGAAELHDELSRIAKVRGLPQLPTTAVTGMDASLVSIEDGDFPALLAALSRPGAPTAPTFLFSGPPGAGKSVAARMVAEHMGRPVLVKRVSELLGMYVSLTEKQIVAAFAEARAAGAVLVLDEADSLLFPRQEAIRSWEISATNTMLVELEARTVPVVCTTNLFERLDVAALRRFDMKLTFGFLGPDQARAAFERFFGCAAPDDITELRHLTPGDFRTVKARTDLFGQGAPKALLNLLRRECAMKPEGDAPRRIGFVS